MRQRNMPSLLQIMACRLFLNFKSDLQSIYDRTEWHKRPPSDLRPTCEDLRPKEDPVACWITRKWNWASNRQQAIIWTYAGLVCRHIYASLGFKELKVFEHVFTGSDEILKNGRRAIASLQVLIPWHYMSTNASQITANSTDCSLTCSS